MKEEKCAKRLPRLLQYQTAHCVLKVDSCYLISNLNAGANSIKLIDARLPHDL